MILTETDIARVVRKVTGKARYDANEKAIARAIEAAIIAKIGEPVAYIVKDDEGEQLMYPAAIFKYKMANEDDIVSELYRLPLIAEKQLEVKGQ